MRQRDFIKNYILQVIVAFAIGVLGIVTFVGASSGDCQKPVPVTLVVMPKVYSATLEDLSQVQQAVAQGAISNALTFAWDAFYDSTRLDGKSHQWVQGEMGLLRQSILPYKFAISKADYIQHLNDALTALTNYYALNS
jgi:hypothetical protein